MKFILVGLLSVLLLACNQEAQTKNTSIEKQPHEHFIGKPQAAISLNYEYLNSTELNEILEIKLVFKVSRDTDALYVDYRVGPGLKLLDSQSGYQFNNMSKGSSEEIIVRVIPESAGQQVINISAAIDVKGMKQSRAFMVPVTTSSTNQLKSNQITPAKEGMKYIPSQNVISMPATETSQ